MTDPRWLKVHSEQVFGSILFESWFVYDDSLIRQKNQGIGSAEVYAYFTDKHIIEYRI